MHQLPDFCCISIVLEPYADLQALKEKANAVMQESEFLLTAHFEYLKKYIQIYTLRVIKQAF